MKNTNLLLILLISLIYCLPAQADTNKWKITAYCACVKCCGPNAKGITASGKIIKPGMVACNWLKFGTRVNIIGLGTFTVEDRGAKSLFGDKDNHIKHIDVYIPKHNSALSFGVKWKKVKIN
jgi:3D (Asp-Asp-Asp) domain-containing protein